MKTNHEIIHLAVAFDQNFQTPFYVLLTSIFRTNQNNRICIHAITTGVSQESQERMTSFVKASGSQIIFYALDNNLLDRIIIPEAEARYTQAVYYRFFFSFLVGQDVEKLIYIDTDVIIIGDLSELYNQPISEPVAAIADPGAGIRQDLGLTQPGDYFNSGVLLMNLNAWRAQRISERAIDFINEFPEKCIYVDQDALNAVLIGNWKKLDPKFNLMDCYVPNLLKMQYGDFLKDKVIIHFNRYKPWNRLCQMRLKYLYYHYFEQSPESEKAMYQKFPLSVKNIGRLLRNNMQDIYYNYLALHKLYRKN